MADKSSPALNPALKLRVDPVPETIEGRGKSMLTTKMERLESQQNRLEWDVRSVEETLLLETVHAGNRLLLHVQMFEDSLAPTHRPMDILPVSFDCRFIAPMFDGYLVEIDTEQLARIANQIAEALNWRIKSDISRVRAIKPYRSEDVLRGNLVEELWDRAVEGNKGKFFNVWLRPYSDTQAREDVLREFEQLSNDGTVLTIEASPSELETHGSSLARRASPGSGSVARALRRYRRWGVQLLRFRLKPTSVS